MKKRIMTGLLVVAMLMTMFPVSALEAKAASVSDVEEEEEFLSVSGSVVAQYTQGTTATVYLEVSVSETSAGSYGVVINGTRYAKTGTAVDGKYLVQLSNLKSAATYTAYPYAGDLVAEDGITFKTGKTTTSSGNMNSSYYSLNAGGIAYCVKDTSGTIDIQGAGQKKTTYSNAGWKVLSSNSSMQVYAVPTIVEGVSGSQYVRLTYVVRNNTSSSVSGFKFGIHSDSMIGSNDSAPVYTTSYGMRVAESTASTALAFAVITKTSNAADGLGRMVDNVTTQWYGNYGSRTSNVYNAGPTSTLTNTDSGMALSWQNISLTPGETKTYSVIFGVANSSVLSKVYQQLSAPAVTDKTYNSVTIDTVAGQTYYIETSAGTAAKYQASENGSYTFTGLTGNTSYSLYTEKTAQDQISYIPSNNTAVKTPAAPLLKQKIEGTASFRTTIGSESSLESILTQKIPGLTRTLTISSAELVNAGDSQYVTLSENGTKILGNALTPDGYKVLVKITMMRVDYSEDWGNGVEMNDVIMRVRVTESEVPYLIKDGSEITVHSTEYHGVKSVKYSYTGDTRHEYTTWYDYYTYGKSTEALKAVNGVNGYKAKTGTVTQTGVDEDNEPLYDSTLDGAVIDLSKIGYYTFILKDSDNNEYIQYLYIDPTDWAKTRPRLYQEDNQISFVNNDSGLYKVSYLYSGTAMFEYNYFAAFVQKGKENTKVNTSAGYRVVKGTNTGTEESAIGGQSVRLPNAGWYTFLMTYKGGREVAYNIQISEEQAQTCIPQLSNDGIASGVKILDNGSRLTKVKYQYSSPDTEYRYTTFASYVNNGKSYPEWNGTAGYKSISGTVADNVSSLDGRTINLIKSGWYTFLFTYTLDGKAVESADTVYIAEDFTDMSVTASDYRVTYRDSLVQGNISEYAYQYAGTQEPDLDAFEFTADKTWKNNIQRTEAGAECSFTVDQGGWYVVKIKDTSFGTRYYKVLVTEPEPITNESETDNFPYLNIDTVNINALSPSGEIKFIRIGKTGRFTAGGAVSVTETGIYKVQVIDDTGKLYELTANISTLSNKVLVDTEALESIIDKARDLIQNSGYITVPDVNNQTEAGSYVSEEAYAAFEAAIAEAEQKLAEKESQKVVNNAAAALKSAVTRYNNAVKQVIAELISVNGSTITIAPTKESHSLMKVVYNAQDSEILPRVAASWTQLCQMDRTTITSFGDSGTLALENVADGIYTFLVKVNEAGVQKEYIQYAVVAAGNTQVKTAQNQLETTVYQEITALYHSLVKESEAAPGQSYVSDAAFAKLQTAYDKAEELLSGTYEETAVRETFIPFMAEWIALKANVEKSVSIKEDGSGEPDEPPVMQEAEINAVLAADGKSADVTVSSPDLKTVYVSYGAMSSWNSMVSAGYTKAVPKDGTAGCNVLQNGTYTVLIKYTDGSEVYKSIYVSDIVYPFTVAEENGIFRISFDNLADAAYVSYGYGDGYDTFNSEGLICYDAASYGEVQTGENELGFQAWGNGLHSVFVKFSSGMVYQVQAEAAGCTEPVIIQHNGQFAVYANGFAIKSVAYAAGEYTSWDQMYAEAYYISSNIWLNEADFIPGRYTFCFRGYDGTDWLKTITIE